jgi:Cd(II)/Pb(II)-responsive transcriptional regulator
MRIGELAKATGTPIETIRFYERERLLPAPDRTEGNYRIYGDPHAERLSFIRHCRSLDMALDEIRLLLQFKDAPGDSCAEVNDLLDDHIGHVVARVRELKNLERQLRSLREQCQEVRGAQSCGILKKLSSGAKTGKEKSARHHVHGTHR